VSTSLLTTVVVAVLLVAGLAIVAARLLTSGGGGKSRRGGRGRHATRLSSQQLRSLVGRRLEVLRGLSWTELAALPASVQETTSCHGRPVEVLVQRHDRPGGGFAFVAQAWEPRYPGVANRTRLGFLAAPAGAHSPVQPEPDATPA
jgi:hypothetical protein